MNFSVVLAQVGQRSVFFYCCFYLWLGSFFIGMLAIFMQIMPKDKPTYYGESGTIGLKGLNPALGFRPQIDSEKHIISYSFENKEDGKNYQGYQKYANNLKNFLDRKYSDKDDVDDNTIIKCESGVDYTKEFNEGKSCEFDYKTIYKETPCTTEFFFGYDTEKPCVLLKVNKIIDFKPKGTLKITCYPDNENSKKNFKGVTYYSEVQESKDFAVIDSKYFPFNGQKSYRAPFVWVQFDLAPSVMVNIECRVSADNIDYERVTRRGLTKIDIQVTK